METPPLQKKNGDFNTEEKLVSIPKFSSLDGKMLDTVV
jgi:hypothetical protein